MTLQVCKVGAFIGLMAVAIGALPLWVIWPLVIVGCLSDIALEYDK